MIGRTIKPLLLGFVMIVAFAASNAVFSQSVYAKVWHLPANTTTQQIINFFSPYGEVVDVKWGCYRSCYGPPYAHAHRSHWHLVAYVSMETDAQLQQAMRALDGKLWRGHYVKVRYANAVYFDGVYAEYERGYLREEY